MKMVAFKPIIDKVSYSREIEKLLKYELYQAIFKPLFDILGVKAVDVSRETRKNAKPGALQRAIDSGKISYEGGMFRGKFSADTSKEIRNLGGKWDNKQKAYRLKMSEADVFAKGFIAKAAAKSKADLANIEKKLGEIEENGVPIENIDEHVSKVVDDLRAQFERTKPADLEVGMAMSGYIEDKIKTEYVENLNLYVKDWADEQVIRLRGVVQDNAAQGYRSSRLVEQIQAEYNVTENKARFLARQETALLVSKFRESTYKEAGVDQYKWSTSGDRRVRSDHKELNGRVFSWDDPPIVDRATGRRGHPGEDFGCRCVAIPIRKVRE